MDDFATLGYFPLHFLLHEILMREIHLLHIFLQRLILYRAYSYLWHIRLISVHLRYSLYAVLSSLLLAQSWNYGLVECLTLFYLLLFEWSCCCTHYGCYLLILLPNDNLVRYLRLSLLLSS